MPGSIKIDDGSGNYTILTNAGSLGSDKTITIPNETATIATTTATNLGGLVKLAEYTFSNDADKDLDVLDENNYIGYLIHFKDIILGTDEKAIRVGLRNDGSDVLTSSTTHRGSWHMATNSSASFQGLAANPTGYFEASFNFGNATNEMLQSTCQLWAHGTQKLWEWANTYEGSDGVQDASKGIQVLRNNATVDGIRIYASTGNIASGTVCVWGYKK